MVIIQLLGEVINLRGYGSLLLVPISDVIIIKMEDRLLLHVTCEH